LAQLYPTFAKGTTHILLWIDQNTRTFLLFVED